jgi:hypothetical protein
MIAMARSLFILDDAPYGTERSYNDIVTKEPNARIVWSARCSRPLAGERLVGPEEQQPGAVR